MQVTQGKHAGAILITNHESWYGGFEFLAGIPEGEQDEAEEFFEAAGLDSIPNLETLTTDEVVDILQRGRPAGLPVASLSLPRRRELPMEPGLRLCLGPPCSSRIFVPPRHTVSASGANR